jgi:hypothetical protein
MGNNLACPLSAFREAEPARQLLNGEQPDLGIVRLRVMRDSRQHSSNSGHCKAGGGNSFEVPKLMRCRWFALFDGDPKSGVEASQQGSSDLPLRPFECVNRPITLNLIQNVTFKYELHCPAAFILWYQNERVPGINLISSSDRQRWRWLTVEKGLIWEEITSDPTKNRLPLSDQGALGWFARATPEQQKATGDGEERDFCFHRFLSIDRSGVIEFTCAALLYFNCMVAISFSL